MQARQGIRGRGWTCCDALYRIYANSETGLGFAREFADENSGFVIA